MWIGQIVRRVGAVVGCECDCSFVFPLSSLSELSTPWMRMRLMRFKELFAGWWGFCRNRLGFSAARQARQARQARGSNAAGKEAAKNALHATSFQGLKERR